MKNAKVEGERQQLNQVSGLFRRGVRTGEGCNVWNSGWPRNVLESVLRAHLQSTDLQSAGLAYQGKFFSICLPPYSFLHVSLRWLHKIS